MIAVGLKALRGTILAAATTGIALMNVAMAAPHDWAAQVKQWRAVSDREGMRIDVGAVPMSRQGDVARGVLRMQYAVPQRTFDRHIEYDRMDGELELNCVQPAYRPLTGRAYLRGVLVQEVVGSPAEAASPAPQGGQAMEMIVEACG